MQTNVCATRDIYRFDTLDFFFGMAERARIPQEAD